MTIELGHVSYNYNGLVFHYRGLYIWPPAPFHPPVHHCWRYQLLPQTNGEPILARVEPAVHMAESSFYLTALFPKFFYKVLEVLPGLVRFQRSHGPIHFLYVAACKNVGVICDIANPSPSHLPDFYSSGAGDKLLTLHWPHLDRNFALGPHARVWYLVRAGGEALRGWCISLISYDINVLGIITRTAWYYADTSYLKKQLSDIFLCELAES